MQGMETTRASTPRSHSISCAFIIGSTSEPLASSSTSGAPLLSESTYPPRSAALPLCAYSGKSWRVATMQVGRPSVMATAHAAAVSRPSAGRYTSRPGTARRPANCSTG